MSAPTTVDLTGIWDIDPSHTRLGFAARHAIRARDPAAVGRTIRLDDRTVTIVGVMGKDFTFPDREAQLWRPLFVTTYFAGRRPLRSRVAPMTSPSVNASAAGPSHGSTRHEWYS